MSSEASPDVSSESQFEKVGYEFSGGVATVTLDDPEKRNMLSGQMRARRVAAMKLAKADVAVRSAGITGAGDKAFCAGVGLGGFAAAVPLLVNLFASASLCE